MITICRKDNPACRPRDALAPVLIRAVLLEHFNAPVKMRWSSFSMQNQIESRRSDAIGCTRAFSEYT
jgi:hypothetical protein